MKFAFSTIVTILAAGIVTAVPSPQGGVGVSVDARSVEEVTFCPFHIRIACLTQAFTSTECEAVPVVLQNDLRSITVPAGFECTVYSEAECGGSPVNLLSAGTTTIPEDSTSDTRISFRCVSI